MSQKFLTQIPKSHRRLFLQQLGVALSVPWVSDALRFAIFDQVGGEALAQAQGAGPVYFLEVNFRDQWDFGGAILPSGLGANLANLPRQGDGGAAIFSDVTLAAGSNMYLTAEAAALTPHIADIAIMEMGEGVIGSVHGHEASNALRSPGRTNRAGAGKIDMATSDKRPNGRAPGNEVHYSSSPTPAVLHNYVQKMQGFRKNGILLRSSIRSGVHTFYHFEGNLPNAQLDRFFDKNSLLNAFTAVQSDQNNVLFKYRSLISELLGRLDKAYLEKVKVVDKSLVEHENVVKNIADPAAAAFSLALTPEEIAQWTEGIPGQFECPGDDSANCVAKPGTMNLGEMFGYVAKLFTNDVVRTAAIDFDFHDVHTARTALVLKTQGTQTAVPLARLIASLKAAGIWDRTVVAMYTTDGSRSIKRNSVGTGTKNAVMLAGGQVKGGYYGDIRYANANTVTFHRPDANGNPVANGTDGGDMRVPSADVYKTVAHLAGIPAGTYDNFPDVQPGNLLNYFIKPT